MVKLPAFAIILGVLAIGCQHQLPRETVLDGIVTIEDSLRLTLPERPRLCDAFAGEKRYVSIGDCKLYVETAGQGTPIVFIHGGPGGTHHYFHPWFAKAEKKHQVIYYDQRGTGLSDFNPGTGYSFQQAVDDLENLRKQLGIDRWIVCGHSYGGALAQYYTVNYPEHVLGMVLISALPLFESDALQSMQEKYLSAAEQQKRSEIIKAYLGGKLTMELFLYNLAINGDWKRQYFYKPTPDEMIRSARYEWVNDTDFNSLLSESYANYHLQDAFADCPIPTLICEGKQDLTWGDKKAEVFKASHPHAQLVIFEQAGHQLFMDEPVHFMSTLLKFTQQLQAVQPDVIRQWKQKNAHLLDPPTGN